MQALAIHDATEIKVWLVGELPESAAAHIENGYPHLLPAWQAGELTAAAVEAADGEEYQPELFEVVAGEVRRKP